MKFNLLLLKKSLALAICLIFHTLYGQLLEKSKSVGVDQLTISFDLQGGGVAFFDYNNDGWDDLIVTGAAVQDKLFRNLGNGTFLDVTEFVGLDNSNIFKTTGVSTGDLNNDGFTDVIIGTEKQNHCIIYLNHNGDYFQNISASAGINSKKWTIGASLIDVNLDGLLDVYLLNYIERSKPVYGEDGETVGFDHECYSNDLYINNGDNTFTDATDQYGLGDTGCALASAGTDINNDNIADILIANDFGEWVEPNKAYLNQHPDLSFLESGNQLQLDSEIYGMGIGVGDINADGLLDYYVTNLGKNALLINNGNEYLDLTDEYGVANEKFNDLNSTSWGTVIVDINNDGYEDLLVSNGYIPSSLFIATSEVDPNKLFINQNGDTLLDQSLAYQFSDSGISRGMAVSDYDMDGDMDVAVTKLERIRESEGNMLFYENITENDYKWIKVKLEGSQSNYSAFGSKVTFEVGDRIFIDEVRGGSSHISQNSSVVHFGLGNTSLPGRLKINWTNGLVQEFDISEYNKMYFLKEGAAEIHLLGCMNSESPNYDPFATKNFACVNAVIGCLDPRASNYNSTAGLPGICEYEPEKIGCMDSLATNYDPSAIIDDQSCKYIVTGIKNLEGNPILVYPTKVQKDWIVIESKSYFSEISIYSIAGRTAASIVLNEPKNRKKIMLNGIEKGVYVVRIQFQDNLSYSKKIVIDN